jgi:hypothetical protein
MSSDAHAPRRLSLLLALALALTGAAACGSSSTPANHPDSAADSHPDSAGSHPDSAASHPDTGYGANQPVPATVNCTDFCTRTVDCGTQLCNEDTMSTNYTALAQLATAACASACNATVLAQFTPANWQCLFQSSCRQVFGENVCGTANTKYSCN